MDALRSSSRPPVIRLTDLAFSYPSDRDHNIVLENLNLEVSHGDFVALVGQSGAGKSTLLRVIAGLMPAARGHVQVEPASDPASRPIGMVFQDARLLPWRRVSGNIEYGLEGLVMSSAERRERVSQALALVGLEELKDRWPHHLSGGQRQRVGLARALAVRPSLLLMDEPFAALDAGTRHGLQDQLLRISRETGTSIIFVTHDIDEAVYLADRALVLGGTPAHIVQDITVNTPHPRQRQHVAHGETSDSPRTELYQIFSQREHSTVKLVA